MRDGRIGGGGKGERGEGQKNLRGRGRADDVDVDLPVMRCNVLWVTMACLFIIGRNCGFKFTPYVRDVSCTHVMVYKIMVYKKVFFFE